MDQEKNNSIINLSNNKITIVQQTIPKIIQQPEIKCDKYKVTDPFFGINYII
jgi:hypothetical protein